MDASALLFLHQVSVYYRCVEMLKVVPENLDNYCVLFVLFQDKCFNSIDTLF